MPLPVGSTGAGGAGASVPGVVGSAVAAVVVGSVDVGAAVVGASVVGPPAAGAAVDGAAVDGPVPGVVVDAVPAACGEGLAAATTEIGQGAVRGGRTQASSTVTSRTAGTEKEETKVLRTGHCVCDENSDTERCRAEGIAEVQMDPTSSADVGRRRV